MSVELKRSDFIHLNTLKMLKLKDQVEVILKDYPASRDSDITLTIALWKKFYSAHIKTTQDGSFGILLQSLYALPSQESVKRLRALIQNDEHRLLPTDSRVRKQRRIKEEEWRMWVNQNNEYKRI
jgi:hypothetical protein